MSLRPQIACYELKGDLSPAMLKKIFQIFRNFPGFIWKTMQALLGGKSCFSNTNDSNRSLLLRYTAKNSQVT